MMRVRVSVAMAIVVSMSSLAVTQEQRWYKGNTHVHAFKTPSAYPPDVPAKWYGSHGYDFIVQTEHEWVVDPSSIETPKGFLLIQGQEITQAVVDATHPLGVRHTHVNGLGITSAIMPASRTVPNAAALPVGEMWRQTAAQMSVTESYRRNLDLVRRQQGIPQINHPNASWSVRLGDLLELDGPYLFEIWNAYPRGIHNLGGISERGETTPSVEAMWDELLSAGKVVWGVASDDTHDYTNFDKRDAPTPGKAWIMVRAGSLTSGAILDSLRSGRFYASNGVYLEDVATRGRTVSIRIAHPPNDPGYGEGLGRFKTVFVGRKGRILKESVGMSASYAIRGDEGYVRAIVTDSNGQRAWTQPVFVRGS